MVTRVKLPAPRHKDLNDALKRKQGPHKDRKKEMKKREGNK